MGLLRITSALGLVTMLAAAGLEAACGAELKAEFAIRWAPGTGGPKSVSEAAKILSVDSEKPEIDNYQVRYFKIKPPAEAPAGLKVIARKRTNEHSGKTELMLKYRSDSDISGAIDVDSWKCPLDGRVPGARLKDPRKYEVDISVWANGSLRRAYSLSCAVQGEGNVAFPSEYGASPIGKPRAMVRKKFEELTIDEWRGSPAQMLIEVSKKGVDRTSDISEFNEKVAKPLLDSGITPIPENKSP